ncbi:hypothetical protein D3C87_1594370 [compost metagenome]
MLADEAVGRAAAVDLHAPTLGDGALVRDGDRVVDVIEGRIGRIADEAVGPLTRPALLVKQERHTGLHVVHAHGAAHIGVSGGVVVRDAARERQAPVDGHVGEGQEVLDGVFVDHRLREFRGVSDRELAGVEITRVPGFDS